MWTSLWIGGLFFSLAAVFILFSSLREKEFKLRWFQLLRIFFPSWRFFEDLHPVTLLTFRWVGEEGTPAGDFLECFVETEFSPFRIFLSANSNLQLAQRSLVDQFVTDVAETAEENVENLISYSLMVRLVQFQIRQLGLVEEAPFFQFRVSSALPGSEKSQQEELFLSSTHPVTGDR